MRSWNQTLPFGLYNTSPTGVPEDHAEGDLAGGVTTLPASTKGGLGCQHPSSRGYCVRDAGTFQRCGGARGPPTVRAGEDATKEVANVVGQKWPKGVAAERMQPIGAAEEDPHTTNQLAKEGRGESLGTMALPTSLPRKAEGEPGDHGSSNTSGRRAGLGTFNQFQRTPTR